MTKSTIDILRYVSRGGFKLEKALEVFQISPAGKICADLGSSTGGFVDCLLENGAKKVYAVETGYGLLDWKLRNNPKVVVLERTNALYVKLPEPVDLVTIDTSWTRQEKILENAIKMLKTKGAIITLIKPHYEAEKNELRKGVVLDKKTAESIMQRVINKVVDKFGDNLEIKKYIQSPIEGAKGKNIEFLLYLAKK